MIITPKAKDDANNKRIHTQNVNKNSMLFKIVL